jgi:hypothetical protein
MSHPPCLETSLKDSFHFTEMISINYGDICSVKSGVVTLQIEYSPSDLSIIYSDVKYSDKEIEKRIETNPHVMKNIDSYLRKKMLTLESNLFCH